MPYIEMKIPGLYEKEKWALEVYASWDNLLQTTDLDDEHN